MSLPMCRGGAYSGSGQKAKMLPFTLQRRLLMGQVMGRESGHLVLEEWVSFSPSFPTFWQSTTLGKDKRDHSDVCHKPGF